MTITCTREGCDRDSPCTSSFCEWPASADARVAALEAALKPFAKLSKADPKRKGCIFETRGDGGDAAIKWEHMHAARAALASSSPADKES